ncbi:MAG: glycosyltransferase [Desulfocurvibacter africanus]
MRVAYYCQHVLGMGHFFRSLEIAKALADHEVDLISGGPEVRAELPAHVSLFRLPGLMMNDDFSELYPLEPGRSLEEVKNERTRLLSERFLLFSPDLFLVELFPFGRNQFSFELLPLLQDIRDGHFGPVKVVCSLRDILVEKRNQEKYEARVVKRLNEFFDLLAVHADPALLRLDETFGSLDRVRIPVSYTGFVTTKPTPGAGIALRREFGLESGQKLIVASIGGGKVGGRLLFAALQAFARLDLSGARMHVFSGPYMDGSEFLALEKLASTIPGVVLERFTDRFLDYLDAADLSLSQAGYNTAMNILATGVPALVWPFDQNREQRLRAERLEQLGALGILEDADLNPERLVVRMAQAMEAGRRSGPAPIDLDGAANTARLLQELAS